MLYLQAANFLNIKDLLDLTCRALAAMIKGKTLEEIHKIFNIKDLLYKIKDPEEMYKIKDLNIKDLKIKDPEEMYKIKYLKIKDLEEMYKIKDQPEDKKEPTEIEKEWDSAFLALQSEEEWALVFLALRALDI